MFKTGFAVLMWKCLNSTVPGYLSELCIPVASASGQWHLMSASTSILQVVEPEPWLVRRASLLLNHLCGTVSLLLYRDQRWHCTISCDNSRPIFSVSHLMCSRTQGTSTTAWHCCRDFVIMAQDTKLPTYLHDYRPQWHYSHCAVLAEYNLKCMQYLFLFCVYVWKHSFCDFCLQRYFFLENGILTYAKSAAEVRYHIRLLCYFLLAVICSFGSVTSNNSGHIVHKHGGASASVIWHWSKGGDTLASKRILAPRHADSLFSLWDCDSDSESRVRKFRTPDSGSDSGSRKTWTPISGPEWDCDYDSGTYCMTYW